MKNSIYDAFDQIHAEDALKQKTKESVFKYNERKAKHSLWGKRPALLLASAMLCLCICFGGYQLYFIEAFAISVDVNPSIEMGINHFDKVISIRGYNKDGIQIAEAVDVKHMSYISAVDCVVEEERHYGYLLDQDDVSITIDCNDQQYEKIKENISACEVQEKQTISIDKCEKEAVTAAHENDMSFGKYAAYQKVQEVRPETSVEEVKVMTIKEINTLINGDSSGTGSQEGTPQVEEIKEDTGKTNNSSTANANTNVNASTNANANANTNANANASTNANANPSTNANANASTNANANANGNANGNTNANGNGNASTDANANANTNANANANANANTSTTPDNAGTATTEPNSSNPGKNNSNSGNNNTEVSDNNGNNENKTSEVESAEGVDQTANQTDEAETN